MVKKKKKKEKKEEEVGWNWFYIIIQYHINDRHYMNNTIKLKLKNLNIYWNVR